MYICARVNGFRFHKKITLLYTTYLSANYHPNRSMDFSMKSLANFFWVCMFNPHFMLWKFGCFWHWFNEKCIAEFLQVTVKHSICRGKIRKNGKMKSLKKLYIWKFNPKGQARKAIYFSTSCRKTFGICMNFINTYL